MHYKQWYTCTYAPSLLFFAFIVTRLQLWPNTALGAACWAPNAWLAARARSLDSSEIQHMRTNVNPIHARLTVFLDNRTSHAFPWLSIHPELLIIHYSCTHNYNVAPSCKSWEKNGPECFSIWPSLGLCLLGLGITYWYVWIVTLLHIRVCHVCYACYLCHFKF